jgi:PKD repeat protein
MRLPWISQPSLSRGRTRRKRPVPLRVRKLERRRVLDAAVTDLVLAPADLDGATAVHDTNEGTQIQASANATGIGALSYEWTLSREATVIATSTNATYNFTPLDDGNYSLTLKVTDSTESTATRTEEILVHNVRPVLVVAPDQTIDEGSPLNLSALSASPLGLFVDKGILDTYTATVDWGDGSAIEAPVIFATPSSGTLGGNHTYTDDGIYEVTVTISDDDGGSDTKSFFVTVENVAPTAALGNSGPVNEGSSAMVSFTSQFDPSSNDTAAGFRYAYDLDNDGAFDVGDGTFAGSVTNDTQLISAALLADGTATRTVKARIIDQDGGFTDYTTDVTVNNVAPTLTNISIDDNSLEEGESATIHMTIDDAGAIDVFAVEVDWQDGSAADTISGLGLADASGVVGSTSYQWDAQTRALAVTHLYADDNPTATSSDDYAVALTVRDDDLGASGPYTVGVTVANVRPVLVVAEAQTVDEGALLDLSAIGAPPLALFVDSGVLDSHTATVDWGDGSTIEPPVIFFTNGAGTLGSTHTYQSDGNYTVTVTVTDDDGGVDTAEILVTVVNVAPTGVLTNDGPVDEGSSANVSFDNQFDPSPTDTAAGFRYAYDFDNDGTFEIGGTGS